MDISLDKKHRVLAKQSSHHNHSLQSNPVLYSDSIFSVPPLSPHDQAAQSVYHTSVELGPQTRLVPSDHSDTTAVPSDQ